MGSHPLVRPLRFVVLNFFSDLQFLCGELTLNSSFIQKFLSDPLKLGIAELVDFF